MTAEAEAGGGATSPGVPGAPRGGETQEEPSFRASGRSLSRQDPDLGLLPLDLGVRFGCCKPPTCGPWSRRPQDVATACSGPQAQPSPEALVTLRHPWAGPPLQPGRRRGPARTFRLSAMMTTLGSVRALSSCLVARFFSRR